MKRSLSRPALILLGLVLLIVSSCKKDPYEIGYDLLPGSDTLNVSRIDTSTVRAYSLIQDSVRTDKRLSNIIGSIMDPVFGVTTSTFYTQFILSAEAPAFGSNPQLDSVVLIIPYSTFYGDTNTVQTLKVYEISQDMNYDSIYFANQTIQTYPNLLANYTFKGRPHDSVTIYGVKTQPHMRINLSNLTHYFGNKLLQAPAEELQSQLKFVKFMKGLAIQAEPVAAGGALYNVNYKDVRLGLYFKNNTGDSLSYTFLIDQICARANYFNHNNYNEASPELKAQVLNHDTTLGKQQLYIQGMGGIQTKVRLPYIESLKNLGKIAINDAKLVLTNIEIDTTKTTIPVLYLIKKDSIGRMAYLTDYGEGTNYFGGEYSKSNKTYTFRITRHLQQILLGQMKNYDLYIMATNPFTTGLSPYRSVLNGTSPANPNFYGTRLRLEVIYTKLY